MKVLLLLLAIALVLLIGLRLLFGHFNIGSQALRDNGKLQDCPDSPNCHTVLVNIADAGNGTALIDQLLESARAMPRSEVIEKSDTYLHVIFTSALLGFKDDLECLIETTVETGTVTLACKSASRVGYSDFDVNRQRVETLLAKAAIRQVS